MPLQKGSGKETISKNIKMEMAHGKPQRQSIAIAMRMADMPKRKKKKNLNKMIAEAKASKENKD